jgi:Uma2 family endonuclease
MSTTTPVTASELTEMPADGKRHELVDGELRMMSPSGWRHGEIVGNLHGLLWQHVRAHGLGKVFGAETGFLLSRDPDTVRAPDISFIARESLPTQDPPEAFWPGPPDLAVEVLSPSEKTGEVVAKIRCWLDAGTREVWVVDPPLCSVTVYRSMTDLEVRTASDQLESADVVPGFRCAVQEIFPARS